MNVSIVFTENHSDVKNFSSQTCSVLNLANLAILCQKWGARDGAVVRALAFHQSGLGSANPGVDLHTCVEFVVGSLLCSERFFSGYSGFPLSSKINISKFQFDQESGTRKLMKNYFVDVLPLNRWLFYLLLRSDRRERAAT